MATRGLRSAHCRSCTGTHHKSHCRHRQHDCNLHEENQELGWAVSMDRLNSEVPSRPADALDLYYAHSEHLYLRSRMIEGGFA